MRNWALLVTLFAIPLVAQVEESLRAEIDSLRTELQGVQTQLRENQPNPSNLGERLTEAYEAGAAHGKRIMNLVTGILTAVSIIVALFAAFGIWQALRLRNIVKATKSRAESVQKCEVQAKKHLSEIKKIKSEVEQEVSNIRTDLKTLKKDIAKIKKEVKKIEPLKKEVARVDYMGEGYHYLAKENYEEALKAFDEAIRKDRENVAAYDGKAAALGKWGATLKGKKSKEKFEQAKKNAEKAVELSNDKIGHYNLACALVRLGDLDDGFENLRKSKEIGDDFSAYYAWRDPDLGPLRKPPYRKRFIEVVGPLPEGVEEKPKAKPKTTKPKKKK